MRLFIALLLFPLSISAQETVDIKGFFELNIPEKHVKKEVLSEGISFPWIEEYELRSMTRDFEFRKQEYTFRVTPNTPKKRKAQQDLYQLLNNAPDVQQQEQYCDLIVNTYEHWAILFLLQEKSSILSEYKRILDDKKTVYSRMIGAHEFDVQKIIKLQSDQNDADIEMREIEFEKEFINNKCGINNVSYVFDPFVTVQQIVQFINSEIGKEYVVEDPEAEYEQELILKETAIERAEKKQIFDFAQIRYEGPHSETLDERLSIGIGLRLPNSGNRLLKLHELQIKKDEIIRDQERDSKLLKEKLKVLIQEIQMKIKVYDHFKSTILNERMKLQELSVRVSQEEGFSPIVLLDIEERYQQNRLKEVKLKEEIISNYLEYLDVSGQLCRNPDGGFLKG